MSSYLMIASVLGLVAATPTYNPAADEVASPNYVIPHYEFSYSVSDPHTGDYKAQTEHSTGGVVRGSYSVAEPDGTVRVVDYTAHPDTGFSAVVRRLGPAVHPVGYASKKTQVALPAVLIGLSNHDS